MSFWQAYRQFVRGNQTNLDLFDEITSRILFWTPAIGASSNHDDDIDSNDMMSHSSWREIFYGIHSLHRLMIDLACEDEIDESFGTSVAPSSTSAPLSTTDGVETLHQSTRSLSPAILRITLSVVHNLLPTLLELVCAMRTSRRKRREQQAYVRVVVERIKFALRLTLVVLYWLQLYRTGDLAYAGILQHGGIYEPSNHLSKGVVPSVHDIRKLQRRNQYVGARTARRVTLPSDYTTIRSPSSIQLEDRRRTLLLMLGEILNMYRPLRWAQAEYLGCGGRASWREWLASLSIDLVSLLCLRLRNGENIANKADENEVRRKKIRLLLYLLRSPVWDRSTLPLVRHLNLAVSRIPLVGPLLQSYLWEYVYFWKSPVILEET